MPNSVPQAVREANRIFIFDGVPDYSWGEAVRESCGSLGLNDPRLEWHDGKLVVSVASPQTANEYEVFTSARCLISAANYRAAAQLHALREAETKP